MNSKYPRHQFLFQLNLVCRWLTTSRSLMIMLLLLLVVCDDHHHQWIRFFFCFLSFSSPFISFSHPLFPILNLSVSLWFTLTYLFLLPIPKEFLSFGDMKRGEKKKRGVTSNNSFVSSSTSQCVFVFSSLLFHEMYLQQKNWLLSSLLIQEVKEVSRRWDGMRAKLFSCQKYVFWSASLSSSFRSAPKHHDDSRYTPRQLLIES